MTDKASVIPLQVTLERAQSREMLTGLLHTLMFHRLLGTVKPQRIDVLDITFSGVADAEVDNLIKSKVDALWRALDTIPGGNSVLKRGQIVLTLSERRQKKMIIFTTEEEVAWEQWVLTVEILPNPPQGTTNAYPSLASGRAALPAPTPIPSIIMQILNHVSSVKGRDAVPPITIGGVISPFPYRIDVRVGDQMIPA